MERKYCIAGLVTRKALQQFFHALAHRCDDEVRRNLCKGREHEQSLGKARMGKIESLLVHDEIVQHEEIKVERARPVFDSGRPVSSEGAFDAEQGLEHLPRGLCCFDCDDGIHKPRLICIAHGLRGVQGGRGGDTAQRTKSPRSRNQRGLRRPR